MNTFEEIQQAIRQLSRFQREDLAEWILNSADFGDRVAETAPAYAEPGESRLLTEDEYLKMEESSPIKHEYVAGEIFAMTGAVVGHNIIAAELIRNFGNHLRGGPCRTFTPDMKVRLQVNSKAVFYYPDVMVTCVSQDLKSAYLTNPCLIVEVLSPSTRSTDRREKRLNYRHIPSLEEYVLVAQEPLHVTIYRRSEDWAPQVLTEAGSVAEFRSIGLQMTLEQIYEGVRAS